MASTAVALQDLPATDAKLVIYFFAIIYIALPAKCKILKHLMLPDGYECWRVICMYMIWTNFNYYTDPTQSDMLMILSLDQHAAYVTMRRPLRSISFTFVLISQKGDSTAAARQDFQALDVKLVSSALNYPKFVLKS